MRIRRGKENISNTAQRFLDIMRTVIGSISRGNQAPRAPRALPALTQMKSGKYNEFMLQEL